MEGIKSASSCTLVGIAATFLVSIGNAFYIRKAQQVEREIVQLANTRVVPLYQEAQTRAVSPTDSYDAIAEQRKATERLSRVTRELQQAVTQLQEQITPAGAAVAETAKQADALGTQLVEAAEIMQTALNSIGDQRDGLGEAAMTVKEAAAKMAQEVRKLREELADAKKEQDARQKELASSLEVTHASLRDLLRHFESALNDVAAIADSSPLRQELKRSQGEIKQLVTNVEARLSEELKKRNGRVTLSTIPRTRLSASS